MSSCKQNPSTQASQNEEKKELNTVEAAQKEVDENQKAASASEILARPQVPILCYHQIRNWTANDGKMGKLSAIIRDIDFQYNCATR